MPPIILLFTLRLNGNVDLSLDGTLVQAVASPLLRLGGAAVQLTQGQAIFRALQTQQNNSGTPTVITFSITVPYGNTTTTYTLTSPPLLFVRADQIAAPPFTLTFGNYGLFFRAGQVLDLSNDTALPGFTLQLLDVLGNLASTQQAPVSISFVPNGNVAGVSVSPSQLNITGSTDVTLVIHYSGRLSSVAGILKFQSPNTSTLQTGLINLRISDSAVRFMQFDPTKSFFLANNIGNTAVLGTSLPTIVIQVVNNVWEVDTGFQDVVIVATAPGATLAGNAALVINGVATFSDLKFVNSAPESAVITFTATLSVSMVRTLFSGAVSVSKAPIKARHLSFDANSDVQQQSSLYLRSDATDLVVIPLLSVLMLDSGYQPDYSAKGIALTVSIVSSDTAIVPPVLSYPDQQNIMVQQGFGKVQGLTLSVTAAHQTTPFFVRIQDAAGIRPNLDSATILVVPSVTVPSTNLAGRLSLCRSANTTQCGLSLTFAPEPYSFVTAIDGPITATVGALIPEIRVYVNDLAGPLDPVAPFPISTATLYAFTSTSPASESFLSTDAALSGTWSGSYFSFICLKLAVAPSRLIRLYFAFFYNDPVTGALTQVTGIPTIRTAFIGVATDTTGNFAFQFVNGGDSFISYAGEPAQAVVGVALPAIQVQIIDSLGNVDASGTSTSTAPLLLGVTSSGGSATIDALVPFVNGVATISTLRFLAASFNPIITFTIQTTTAYPLLSQTSIVSGPIMLTVSPINAVAIAVQPFDNCDTSSSYVCVDANLQSMTFANLSSVLLRVQVGAIDSANQMATRPITDSTFTVRVSCEQAAFNSAFSTDATAVVGTNIVLNIPPLTTMNTAFRATNVPLYFTICVVSAPDFPALLDSSVVIGPITVTALASSASAAASCAGAASAPVVVLKLYSPLASTTLSYLNTNFLTNLCYIMGVEASRVTIVSPPSLTSGINTDTTRWEGTRLSLQFSDPTPTSSNRDSAATLAAALVALRPDCQAPTLSIASIFYASDEKGCIRATFQAAVAAADTCASQGFYSTCQCFQDNVISPMGVVCSIDVVVGPDFSTMCQRLSNCAQSEIISVCEGALQDNSSQYAWAFGAVFGPIAFGILVYLAVKGIILRRAPVQLHKEDNKRLF
ncbi:unnamed protein product [Bodo saltans]|uniref:Transmembrane protein n=1 Tax=Bodo saltans TaxID=75058 RepID=A0A0S4JU22_BODSA|nr:unnamed protein product [Bodo saltans]|eukprot:CUG93900.1 unnamed protein product [Bodo saltans]